MMNAWLLGATVLLFGLVPSGIAGFRGHAINRLVGLEMAATVEVLILVLLAEGFHRSNMLDLALTLALLSFGGGLVFVRFLERWL
jgi:multicomponent Na+:H+ antiporter subunit F